MTTISFQEIERDPGAFLHLVQAGENLLVLCGDHAIAEVKPLPKPPAQPRPFGLCAGQFKVPADFDQPLPEEPGF